MKHLVLIAVLLALPAVSGAASYSWTDPSGTMHFTDDLGSVPSKYRAKALRQAAGEEAIPDTKPAVAKNESKPPAASAAAPAGPASQTGSAQGAATPSTKFGDRTAGEWQTEFRTVRSEFKTIEQAREALKRKTGDFRMLKTSQQTTDYNVRNKQLNDEYEAARQRFNQLVEQANKAGLPPEFSQ